VTDLQASQQQRQQRLQQQRNRHPSSWPTQPSALLSEIREEGAQLRTQLEEDGHVYRFDTQSVSENRAERVMADIRARRRARRPVPVVPQPLNGEEQEDNTGDVVDAVVEEEEDPQLLNAERRRRK